MPITTAIYRLALASALGISLACANVPPQDAPQQPDPNAPTKEDVKEFFLTAAIVAVLVYLNLMEDRAAAEAAPAPSPAPQP